MTEDIVVGQLADGTASAPPVKLFLSDLTPEAQALLKAAITLYDERWADGNLAGCHRIMNEAADAFAASLKVKA